MITLEPSDESHSVSIITDDDSTDPVMGTQGICATEEQAIALLTTWRETYEAGYVTFARDDKVGIL